MILFMVNGRVLIMFVEDLVLVLSVWILFFMVFCLCRILDRLFSVLVKLLLVFCWMLIMIVKKLVFVIGICFGNLVMVFERLIFMIWVLMIFLNFVVIGFWVLCVIILM